MVKRLIILSSLLLSILVSQLAYAFTDASSSVSATVDKNPVVVNESFVLKVTAHDDVDNNALDTSALLADFIVGRTSISSQTSMINFKTSRTTTWTTVLIAKNPGNYVIPPLDIEGNKTQEIQLKVLSAADPQASEQKDLFITSEVSKNTVYVQQQLTLTVKLHFSAELKRGSLTEPSLAGASITQIGKDKEEDTIINGRRYRIIERTYAISPQKSGQFILKSPIFSGEIMMPSKRRSNFLSFAETKPVSVIGDEIALTVHPIPDSFKGVWLPSDLLALHQEWQPDVTTFKVGEPITRSITLTAASLSKEQLPKLTMTMPKGLKVYPDQAQLHTGMNNGHLVSQKVRNFAIVASRPGEYLLPEINIPWWNTVTNRYQLATIPAQKITVQANSDIEFNAPTEQEQQTQLAPSTQSQLPEKIMITQSSWLQWLFLTLWLVTLLAWFISAKYAVKKDKKQKVHNQPLVDSYLALLAACKKDDGLTVLSLLVPWLNSMQNQQVISTVDEALNLINDFELKQNFSEEIKTLQQCYYGKTQQIWHGKALIKLIQRINKEGLTMPEHKLLQLNP
jgi:hypothetical protein